MLRAANELLERVDREQRALGYVDMEPHLLHMMLRATIEALFEVSPPSLARKAFTSTPLVHAHIYVHHLPVLYIYSL